MLNPKSKIDMTHQPITILLSGAPGVGKTAIQRLTPRFFRARGIEAAAMGTDDIYTIIDPDWSDPNQRRRDITRANCILLAQNLFQHGVGVVLICGNALYSEQLTQDYVIALRPISAVYHFTLDAQLDVLVERVRTCGDLDAHPPEWLAAWRRLIHTHCGPWTHLIDTSLLTPEATLELMWQKITL